MKKVRLNLKRGFKSWSFVLYDSAESAFYLKDEPIYDPTGEEYRRVVVMRPGELVEVEWVGSEWVYDDETSSKKVSMSRMGPTYEKYDKIRVGKLTSAKKTAKAVEKPGYLELYSGWVPSGEVPWEPDDTQKSIRITPIKGKVVSQFDFSRLFSELTHEEDEEVIEAEKTTASSSQMLN